MSENYPTSIRLARADKEDLSELVKHGIFTNVSDAGRGAMRRGIQAIKEERGIQMQMRRETDDQTAAEDLPILEDLAVGS
ncbi:MAG: hypothetical protein Q8J68_00555 [Methanolobus sp.]|uniref:hypothetical protein n=1 Tax=Methanolobus sp. TaxID=1874737 RepID=UPI00273098D7|nr:hypothetical protein [Methanolobus sp.]MDP2215773.1 hypothetical protein [Methanolobus sp.]